MNDSFYASNVYKFYNLITEINCCKVSNWLSKNENKNPGETSLLEEFIEESFSLFINLPNNSS
ncbi:hypothetical protein BpHYR1_018896 [Brachionus plicatilis]|uniref:Uncharacterized protein n=1 Tax=Brachionus plicatilis TaxID=10195 RepID=A0A3M7R108_BRAPC|nr:hypothetical protein BpHYR1_018896 [Brachionus plicatilis]